MYKVLMRRKHINKRELLNKISINKLIPNIITLSSLFVGLTQIKCALVGKWEFAVVMVLISAILDASDGRLARLLNSCSRFGAELDSIADFAAFGIGPAITLYLYSLSNLNRIGWIASIFFAICMGLRLARFNTHDIENIKTPLSGQFFTGVPAPAGALLAEFPIVLYNAFELDIFKNPYLCLINIIIVGLLCISTLPTLSIKKAHIKREQYNKFFLLIIISVSIIFIFTWKALSILIIMYIISIFTCHRKAKSILNNEKSSKKNET